MLEISNEYHYLVHLIRCTIHDQQPQELPKGLKFERVFECGKFHQVANIAFYSIEKLHNQPEPKLYSQWQAYRDQAVMCDITQHYAAQELREAMQDQGIRYVELQGTKIKPLYPQPDLRTMSDIDFVIDEENIPKAKALLENLGYECEMFCQVEVNGNRPPNTYVEMHAEYFLENCPYRQVMSAPFDAVDDQGQCKINAFYLYNILHIAKHYFLSGCGIRRVLDVYFLNRKYAWCMKDPLVIQGLQSANLVDFAAEFGQLAETWFGAEACGFPESEMARYILNAGVHGSTYNGQKNALEKNFRKTGRLAGARYYLRRFWGNRKDLLVRYPILKRYKILYPFCRLHRIFSILSPKRFRYVRQEIRIVNRMETKEEE